MNNQKKIEWILKIAIAGEFIGHGAFAIIGKAQWIGWMQKMTGTGIETATTLMLIVGILDVVLGLLILIKPIKPIILWMAFWGFFTAAIRPLMGDPIWDFIERFANWGAPLALYYMLKSNVSNNTPNQTQY